MYKWVPTRRLVIVLLFYFLYVVIDLDIHRLIPTLFSHHLCLQSLPCQFVSIFTDDDPGFGKHLIKICYQALAILH